MSRGPVKHGCEGRVWSGYHESHCGNEATIQRDGKWYCKRCDPVTRAERRAARDAKHDAKCARRNRIGDAEAVVDEAERAVLITAKQWRHEKAPTADLQARIDELESAEEMLAKVQGESEET